MNNKTYTPGPWSPGLNGGSVVADPKNSPADTNTGHNDIEYYGGYLIAESIPSQANVNLIAAAPELLESLGKLIQVITAAEEDELYSLNEGIHLNAINEAFNNAKKIVSKAKGEL